MVLDTAAAKTTLHDIVGPKFNIVTKALSGGVDGDGKRRFRATASSTITDLAGDEITLPALEKMAQKFRQGVTIFMDHDYQHVDSAYGLTDGAEIIQRGVDGTGTPVWDLDISGVVNTPNPRAVQLADSIDGGYVKLGASVTAFVREHSRKKQGGMVISNMDVIEASIVGVPENQRSWAQKAALAIKSFHKDEEDTEEMIVTKAIDETHSTDSVETPEETTEVIPEETAAEATETTEAVAETDETGDEAVEESTADSTTGVQESAEETPETTPSGEETETDTPDLEKVASFAPEDVVELVKQTGLMAAEIGRLRTENAALQAKIETQEQANEAVSKEVDLATQVIGEVMKLPLRSKTAGFVGDFTSTHKLFDPDVAEYLSKRERITK